MFWGILLIVGVALVILGLFICDRSGYNDAVLITGTVASVIGFLVCLASITLFIMIPLEIAKYKEMQRSREYFTSEKLNEFNAFVAETKTFPFMYWGYDLTGIEYIKPSEGDSVKVEVKK
jgi:membrane-bound ClpP family serine protease